MAKDSDSKSIFNQLGTFFYNNKKNIAAISGVTTTIATPLTFQGAENSHDAMKLATGSNLPLFIVAAVSFLACFVACMMLLYHQCKGKTQSYALDVDNKVNYKNPNHQIIVNGSL